MASTSQSTRIVIGLIAGLVAGATIHATDSPTLTGIADNVVLIGQIWLRALQMTVLPLLIALLITGTAAAQDTAASGRVAARALLWFGIFLVCSVSIAVILMPLAVSIWPVNPAGKQALLAGLQHAESTLPVIAPLREWIANIVPTNPFNAAASGALLPLVFFTLVFSLAATRLPGPQRTALVGFFQAVGATMLVVVDWVLKVAVIGVFALSLNVGMQGGIAAAGAIAHYLLFMCVLAVLLIALLYPVAVVVGRIPLRLFARAAAPAQAVAFSTQSSLASLPAMLTAAQSVLGIPPRVADVVLPLAVAVFKLTSPALNFSIVVFIAHVTGTDLGLPQLLVGALVAIITSLGIAGIPGQASFLTTTVPIAAAMGVPIELALLLIAVEVIPDIFRTVGNVTADIVVTAVIARQEATTDGTPAEPAS